MAEALIPSSGVRFVVAAPSVAALAQKALLECEAAEPFVRSVKNISDRKVAILVKPNAQGHAKGQHIEPGETFEVVARCHRAQDGRTYLRLRESEGGWVTTRSRKDFWKVVLDSVGGTALEPASSSKTCDSNAKQLLASVDPEGRRVDDEGQPVQTTDGTAATAVQLWKFCALGGRGTIPILSSPCLADGPSIPGALLKAREEFIADAVNVDRKDGRAYLRLQDGRGWVGERSRSDFNRFVLEPLHEDDGGSKRTCKAVCGERVKVVVVQRQTATSTKDMPAKPARCSALQDECVMLRSDSELWPNSFDQRPITSEIRRSLRRLGKYYGRKVRECEEDLRIVEARSQAFAIACQSKTLLETHADTLRKELVKLDRQWTAVVEKAISKTRPHPTTDPSPCVANGRIAPVQVLGEAFHCATLLVEDGSADELGQWYLGPLRLEPTAAAEDLRLMATGSGQVAKKRRVAPDAAVFF